MQISDVRAHATRVIKTVGRTMYGLDHQIRLCLAALYTGGHVLLEGNPGLGKTELVKALGQTLGLPFGRIQFTSDLMPADITGGLILDGGELRFKRGPVFTSLLLADEINRATPKTQSAMLEAMAERHVTVLGERYRLDERQPFIVLATQNPIDHEGTYNLPAAQSDRFMFKVRMQPPDASTLKRIISKRAGPASNGASAGIESLVPAGVDPGDLVRQIGASIRSIDVPPAIEEHITNLYLAVNGETSALAFKRDKKAQIQAAARQFQYGISPRAAGDIMLAAKAWVCLIDHEDALSMRHLGDVIVDTLRHRLRPSLDHDLETTPDGGHELAFERTIKNIVVLTAPEGFENDAVWSKWHQ